MILAEATAPWNVTAYVALGTIGILSVVYLVLQVAISSKKLFGKQPPMHEQIAALRAELVTAAGHHQVEEERERSRLSQKIDGVDRDVRQLRSDISVNGEIRKQTMLDHIDKVRRELDAKISSVAAAQTEHLIRALKGKLH